MQEASALRGRMKMEYMQFKTQTGKFSHVFDKPLPTPAGPPLPPQQQKAADLEEQKKLSIKDVIRHIEVTGGHKSRE